MAAMGRVEASPKKADAPHAQGLAGRGLLCQSVAGVTGMNAVEPVGSAAGEPRAGAACLNCGVALLGEFCAGCGQKARVPRSLSAFFTDFAASLLNFEGKFWRTLPMLAWCPGDLTRRYVDGQRVRFISPVGLYLFTVFLMFATLGLGGSLSDIKVGDGFEQTLREEQAYLARLQAERQQVQARGGDVAALDEKIAEARDDVEDFRRLAAGELPADDDPNDDGPAWLRDAVQRAAADPRGTMTKVQQAASTYSWLLIPLSIPALRLLFPLQRRRLYDHTVFVTYSLSFMMLLVVAGGLLTLAGASAVVPWLLLLPPWHMYRQLKGAYRLSRAGALFRTALLLWAAVVILILWGVMVVAIGALT